MAKFQQKFYLQSDMKINPKSIPTKELHGYLLGAVSPRPIAFATTMDAKGNINLSPFSFFNVFSSNPPIVIFSPSRRGRDNTTKDTYENVLEHKEVAISIVSYDMVEQMSLASTEYEKGVNEFTKSGFTELPSETISPPRVKEAKITMECKVNEVKPLGDQGGAGNLVICEVLLLHINDNLLDANGNIDPYKLGPVGRMGGDYYIHANGHSIFSLRGPVKEKGMGVDQIPETIRKSSILTGNDLGQLGNWGSIPSNEEIELFSGEPEVRAILDSFDEEERIEEELHKLAHDLLKEGEVEMAWKTLMLKY